jgi:activating signal cointegrator 1
MKALSLTQPWATLIALRAKRIETRSWSTPYRGLLAIHAAKGFPRDCQALCYDEPFADALKCEPSNLPRGAIIAVARLVGCTSTERLLLDTNDPAQAAERAFGDYTAGRWAWIIQGVRPLASPIECKGALGLWTTDEAVDAEIARQAPTLASLKKTRLPFEVHP